MNIDDKRVWNQMKPDLTKEHITIDIYFLHLQLYDELIQYAYKYNLTNEQLERIIYTAEEVIQKLRVRNDK